MLAAVLHSPNHLSVEEVPTPTPGPGEVLLKIETTTICGTDGRVFTGAKTAGVRPGVIPGHEIAGRIAGVGDGVEGYQVGQQATVSIVVGCGRCHQCKYGREHLCSNLILIGYWIDGGFAEYMLVPAPAVAQGNVVVTPREIPSRTLSLAEPLSCVLNGQEQMGIEAGDTVVVLGAGPIGLLHTQLAKLRGATQIIVTNRSPQRRELALSMGADLALDPTSDDVHQAILDHTDGRGADAVVVAIGAPELAQDALTYAANAGRVNFFAGFPSGSTSVMEPNLIHYKELRVTGGSNAPRRMVDQAVQILATGGIKPDGIVSEAFSLAQIAQGYEMVMNRSAMKVAIEPELA